MMQLVMYLRCEDELVRTNEMRCREILEVTVIVPVSGHSIDRFCLFGIRIELLCRLESAPAVIVEDHYLNILRGFGLFERGRKQCVRKISENKM